VSHLLATANIVKMNESEAKRVGDFLSLPADLELFCRKGCERFGWQGICITLGERGCAVFDGEQFVVAEGERVEVADTVGAGDAFAAAFVHGLGMKWPLGETARFANRIGALVASRTGGIPEWSMLEAATT
jgi:fructokinase